MTPRPRPNTVTRAALARPTASLCLSAAVLLAPPALHAQTPATPAAPQTLSTPGAPEADAPNPDAQPAQQAFDLPRLLTDTLVQTTSLDDPVWQLDALDGRTPLLIPIRITPGQTVTTLDQPAVSLGGARFVGWYVPTPDPANTAQPGNRNFHRGVDEAADFAQQPRFVAGDSRFAHLLGDPNADPTGGALDQPQPQAEPLAAGPRLARSITVAPDGTITWKLDRSFQGASLKTGESLYLLKLDPLRLRDQQPDAGERIARNQGESTAEFNLRRRAAQEAARSNQQAFRGVREAVQNLPETFTVPLNQLPGSVVWAVMQRQDRRPSLTFEGSAAGLPWAVDDATFAALRGQAGSTGGGTLTTDADPIATLDTLASRGDTLSLRAASLALAGANRFREMSAGDAVARLAQKLVLSKDGPAARTTIDALAEIDPPTDATRRLLDIAAQTDDPLAKLAALRASLRSSADNPAAVARILQQADAVLTDPNGPPAEEVLAALAGTNETSRSGAPQAALPALTVGVRFEAIPADRRPDAIRWVLAHADQPQGLPAAWLDIKLLGGGDLLLRETLDQLAAVEVIYPESQAAPIAEPDRPTLSQTFRGFVFGGDHSATDATNDATPAAGQPDTPALRIAPLPLTSAQHGLFTALNHDDSALRQQAWAVLPAFTLSTTGGATDADAILIRLVETGTAATPTPTTLVPYLRGVLADSTHTAAATTALMSVTKSADADASAQAVAALLNPGTDAQGQPRRPAISQAWNQLEPDARAAFAAAVYRQQLGSDTPVAALAAHDQAGSWFARQLDEGIVPAPGDWLEPLGGETQALDLAGSADDTLAHGALAALAAAVGADADAQRAVIERLGTAPRAADELQTQWPAVQRELIVAQLEDAAGEYRLVLLVTQGSPSPASNPGFAGDPESFPGNETFDDSPADPNTEATDTTTPITPANITLGIVELNVAGDRISLTGDPITLDVPDNFAALRIADPLQLRNFPTPDVARLPLEQVAGPIDLRRNANNLWTGTAAFGPAHTLEVRMEPVR